MNILLTNDDGVNALGMTALENELKKEHDVWVIAPDRERSGCSHGISLKEAIRVRKLDEKRYSCSGSPVDCVLIAYLSDIPVQPDLVISGINIGPNLGTDIIYSGTAAAARQAALMGKPALAVSLAASKKPLYPEAAARFVTRNLNNFIELWNEDLFININVPNRKNLTDTVDADADVVITHPSRRFYKDHLVNFEAPNGEIYYFLKGNVIESEKDPDSDGDAIARGKISVSPIYIHPMNHSDDELFHNTLFKW